MPTPTVSGKRNDPHRKFQFKVRTTASGNGGNPIPTGTELAFSQVSGLRSETEVVEYKEGDNPLRRQLPGRTSFPNVILARGVDSNGHLVQWRKRVVEKGGFVDENLRATVIVTMYDRTLKNPVRQWEIRQAWPVSMEVDDLSGDASDVLIERLELATEEIVETVIA